MKPEAPRTALGYRSMKAHMRRIGLVQNDQGTLDPRSLSKVVGSIDASRDLRFEEMGALKKRGWFFGREGEGISAEATERARALADEARALVLELDGISGSLKRVVELIHDKLLARGAKKKPKKLDPHLFEIASSPAARAANDRLDKLTSRLPQQRTSRLDDPERIDLIELGTVDPGAVLELSDAVARLAASSSSYIRELSELRRTLDDAERYYRENPPGAPPARVILEFNFGGQRTLLSMPKDMITGYYDFEQRIVPGMVEPAPIIKRSDDLQGIQRDVSHTYWMADRAITALTKLADRISGPSPLTIAEDLLPLSSPQAVVFVADAIEEMLEQTQLSSQTITRALEHVLPPKEKPDEDRVREVMGVLAAAREHPKDERGFLEATGVKKS
jgi:hypothetical protein